MEQPVVQLGVPETKQNEEFQTPACQGESEQKNKSLLSETQSVASEVSEKVKIEQENLKQLMIQREEAVKNREYYKADKIEIEIEKVNARIIRENVAQYCYSLEAALDPVYKANMRKIRKFQRDCYNHELALRSDISSRFQGTQQLHLAALRQFDDNQFKNYSRILINSENVKYNRAIEKARKLANEGKFEEADIVAKEAIAENGKVFGQREAEFTTLYKQKIKQLLDDQSKDFTTLLNSSNKTLEEIVVTRSRSRETLYKTLKADLDRVFAKHLEKLNKHFASFNNPHIEHPRIIFNEYYHNYLANKSIIEPPLITIRKEKQMKIDAEKMRQEKRLQREKNPKPEPETKPDDSLKNLESSMSNFDLSEMESEPPEPPKKEQTAETTQTEEKKETKTESSSITIIQTKTESHESSKVEVKSEEVKTEEKHE